ncbi:MAG: DNA methyltransferase, partial [Candidatus Kapaibacterium sp.]
MSIKEASEWATQHIRRKVTPSNISYLIQYGKIKKFGYNGSTVVDLNELEEYYKNLSVNKEDAWRNQLGDDLNWTLSFDKYKEAETTKHVHRLHPYKGKFIPQLVEYFLDSHTDKFKKDIYFSPGDIILDPFCGSGTTMVQGNELGIHIVGIDVSAFNALISNCKVKRYDLDDVQKEVDSITNNLKLFLSNSNTIKFEDALLKELNDFNNKYFPVPEYKYNVQRKIIDGDKYGAEIA